MRFVWLLGLLLGLVPTTALARQRDRLPTWAQQTIALRQAVRQMPGLQTAHPEVASRLSADLSKSLKRPVRIPARRIIQVEWGSAEHHRLHELLGNSVGIGIYPSKRWGHTKLRMGGLMSDAVPGQADPFPSTGTRARVVPADRMHQRFYEAVFVANSPAHIASLQQAARQLVGERQQCGMNCASFITRLLRAHLEQLDTEAPVNSARPYGARLESFRRGESAAGRVWKKAAGASPAMIIVYTPPGDHRSIAHPGFKFDYAL